VPIKGGTAAYYAALGSRNNTYDLYLVAWGPDIPDASGIFPHLFSGAGIRAESSTNVAYFSDPTITARIRSLQAEPDRARAAEGYGALDALIQREHAPVVPFYDARLLSLHGSRLGGLAVSRVLGAVALEKAHVVG